MSKSSVAVIVLAIILALGMILGLTGAWFTHNDSVDGVTGGDLIFRDDAMEVTLVSTGADARILRDADGDGTHELEVAKYSAGTSDLMPGDKVEGSSITISFAVNGSNEAYYVVKTGGKYYSAQGTEITAATGVLKVKAGDELVFEVEGFQIPGEGTENSAQGTKYEAASANLGSVEVRMIQTENISQADAHAYLTDDANWA